MENSLARVLRKGELDQLKLYHLETLDRKRFEKVKLLWLRAPRSLRIRMLRTPPEFWSDMRFSLAKDLLEECFVLTVVPADLLGVRVTLNPYEFGKLSLQEKFACLSQMAYGFNTIRVDPKPSYKELSGLLFAFRMSGVAKSSDIDYHRITIWHNRQRRRKECRVCSSFAIV